MGIYTKTKIIATVGPASSSEEMLRKLIFAGVNVFRLNFSHGTHEDKKNIIENIVKLNAELNTNVGILADLQGPKIRVGEMEENTELAIGDKVIFTTEKIVGNAKKMYVSYDAFTQDIKVGDRILIDDGKIELKTVQILNGSEVMAEVIFGGIVLPKKGINLPDTQVSVPSITPKDAQDLEFILSQKINWIALSFVRQADDIVKLKGIIDLKAHPAKVVAKIEKPEAVANIDAIIKAADAVMVARGDLGVELPVEQMPIIQKNIVRKCNEAAKPVIIATQMMESMIENATPTRAEVTDVANAIFDGADAVMLSAETASGKHPVKVINIMHKILEKSEEDPIIYNNEYPFDKNSKKILSDVICYNACKIAEGVKAKAVIGLTKSGYTAYKLSSFRPRANIFVFSENPDLLNEVSLIWGVRAFYYNNFVSTDQTIYDVHQMLFNRNLLSVGDIVLNTGSMPIQERGSTNTIKVSIINGTW